MRSATGSVAGRGALRRPATAWVAAGGRRGPPRPARYRQRPARRLPGTAVQRQSDRQRSRTASPRAPQRPGRRCGCLTSAIRSRLFHRPGPTGRFRRESRDPREHGLPVGTHLGPPGEGPARVRRLFASVVLVEETGRRIEIMGVHGHDQPVNHFGHQVPPGSRASAPARVAMAPAVAQAAQRLKAAALAHASRPDRAAHRPIRTYGDSGTTPTSTSTCSRCMISRAVPAFGDGLHDGRLGPGSGEVAGRGDGHRQAGRPAGVSAGDGLPDQLGDIDDQIRSGPGWAGSLGVRTSPAHTQTVLFSRR